MDKIVVWGASGHAKVVADIIRLNARYEIAGFLDSVDPQRQGESFSDGRILGGLEQLRPLRERGVEWLIFGFGNCEGRLKLSDVAKSMGFRLATAIHPSAVVAGDATLCPGAVVAAGAVINSCSLIGENTIINTCSSVDHDCSIGDGAHICPGAHLAGQVTVGRGTWVGIGATVIDHVKIGSGSLIGAGAVVVNDIPDRVIAYGNPARIKRPNP